jgi:ureidoacrylate peracid hydrolase
MHTIDIFPPVTEAVGRRRAKEHVFDDFEPTRTALIVIDMQNFFCAEGQSFEVPVARDIVPNINRIAAALRRAGGLVVWVRTTFTNKTAVEWSTFLDYFNTPDLRADLLAGLTADSRGHQFWPNLDIQDGDEIVDKTRFSAFIPGASEIDERLRAKGIDTLLIAGTLTNVCCESTARDASMLNYKTIMVADGNAARNDAQHNASLSNLFVVFCDVQMTDDIVARLKMAAPSGVPAAE